MGEIMENSLKYGILKRQLQKIKFSLNELNKDYENIENLLKKSIIIDNNIIEKENLSNIKNNTDYVINNLETSILPNINKNL